MAKWRGFQGKANIYGRSFETLTHGAALGALTKRIAIFSTVHVPLVTPAFGAKAIATIDHVTHGRAGLNIVCGWNQEEFDLHGVTIDQDRRYEHGLEWFRVWSRLLEGGPEFDWDGEFFHLKRLQTDPVSVQRPWPAVMSAGFSPKGRDFAAQAADVLFTTMSELDQAPALLADIADACRAIRQARRYLHHVARRVPADPARGGGVLPLLRRGDGRRRGPGLLPAPARTGGEGRGRQRDPPSAGQPLHARHRQALRRRLSRRLPAGRHAGRHRC